jgi:hypothetical protein
VHALVEARLGCVDVPVEMDDADIAADEWGDSANIRIADRMVAAQHKREDAARKNVPEAAVHLVEGLLYVGGDGEDVADIHHVQAFHQVDARFQVESTRDHRGQPQAARSVASAGADRRADVDGSADHHHVLAAHGVGILQVRHSHEGGDATECLCPAASKERYGAVLDARRGLQSHRQCPFGFLPGSRRGKLPLPLYTPGSAQFIAPVHLRPPSSVYRVPHLHRRPVPVSTGPYRSDWTDGPTIVPAQRVAEASVRIDRWWEMGWRDTLNVGG